MRKTIIFNEPYHLSGRLDRRYLDSIEYLFVIQVIESDFIGKPREKSKTAYHKIIARITEELRINWHLENDDIIKVLFERAKEFILEKVQSDTLLPEEHLILTTKSEEDYCPFNLSLISIPEKGAILEIEVNSDDSKKQNQENLMGDVQEIKNLPNTILERIPNCDPVIIKFIEEALRCVYQAEALLAGTFMLGAASEKAIHLLIHKYADSIQSEKHREKFWERINKRMISVKYDEFIRSYKSCRNKPIDPVLSQDLEHVITLTFQFSRITRNEIGHPQVVPKPDKGIVIAHIAHFVTYIEKIYALMNYFEEKGVRL